MNSDDVYRDEESTSLLQLQGRSSVRLASLPGTPPPPASLKCCDANTIGQRKLRWYHDCHSPQCHQPSSLRRGAVKKVRTAPTSPVRSHHRAATPRRPLTPTPSVAPPPRSCCPALATERGVDDACNNSFDFSNCGAGVARDDNFRRANDGDENDGEKEDEEVEASLMPSSRWVSFSFTSALTSRRQSESRPSSPSPKPRATMIPSDFPRIYFFDDENMGGGEENCVGGVTACCAPTPITDRKSVV